MSAPAGFNPSQSLLPDVHASITPAMGGGGMIGGATTDFLTKLLPLLKEKKKIIKYKNQNGEEKSKKLNS